MPDLKKCRACGVDIQSNAPFGHCPQCLLAMGFGPIPKEALDAPVESDPLSPATSAEPGASSHTESVSQLSSKLADSCVTGDRIGRYKLLEKIGEGGCGVVYMAEQEEPVRRRVALKVLKLGLDTKEVVARFEAERQALALMEHPHIAKVFDGGATETGRPFFVMELVRGLRITNYCDQKKLSTRQRLDLFMQVCHAVQHAHQKGIIHRDLKPSNILVTVNDGLAVPKVIDFGIAKATGQSLTDKTLFTKFNQFLGSPAYTSPEQAEMTSLDIDTRSDIYSLGVLLYEMLTGRLPFDSRELLAVGYEAMLRTIREKEPPRPSMRLGSLTGVEQTTVAQQRQTDAPKLISSLRGDLDWIAMKCLEKDRARRYETASGLAADIHRHLNSVPVQASPPGNLYRFRKTVRRHKLAFAAGAAVMASLMIGLGAATIMFLRERAERRSGDVARAEVVRKNTELERLNTESRAMLVEAARSDRFVAADKLRLGEEQSAFAHLARACEYDPTSALAAQMAVGALGSWNHALPISILAGHTKRVKSARFSPDGTRIATASFDKTACVWDVATSRLLVTLAGHTGEVSSAEFSPDGRRIVTGSYDNTARVWDPATGETLATLAGHDHAVVRAEFSPDGTRIVTVSVDKTARVWDARSGNTLVNLGGYTNMCITAEFSPDGTRIVTAGDGTAFVWDVVTGKTLAKLAGHTRSLRGARFSPDGTRIVTASVDKTARVWDARSGEVVQTLVGHEGWAVEDAQFSPDGTRIVTAGRDDKTVRIWEVSTGKLLATLVGHEGEVHSAEFSPDGDRIVSVSWSKSDSTARIWDASTGKALATLTGHQAGVWSAQFSPDGKHIVTGSDDKTSQVWDATTLQATPRTPYGSTFSSDGKFVATVSNDRTVRVWDTATDKAVATLAGHTGKVRTAQFSLDGTRIITKCDHGPARLWETVTGNALATLAGPTGAVYIAEFSPDGTRIVTASGTEPVRLWDAITGRLQATLAGHTGAVRRVQFSSDSQRIVTASRDKTARLWDAVAGKEIRTLVGHTGEVWNAQFSPDGTRIVTAGGDDKTVRIWEVSTGKLLTTLAGHEGEVRSAEFSPDGTRMLTVSTQRGSVSALRGSSISNATRPDFWVVGQQIRLWDLATGPLPVTLIENTGRRASAEFALDGTRIITTMGDEPPRLWDATTGKAVATLGNQRSGNRAYLSPDGRRIVTTSSIVSNPGGAAAELWDSATGEALPKLTGHTGFVRSVRFSPDGARIVTSSEDGTVRVWDSATGQQLAILTVRAVVQADKTVATLSSYVASLERSAQFSPDGTRIFITSRDGTVFVWDLLPKDGGPPPQWFPDFLRYMAQKRLNSDGELEALKAEDWLALRGRLRGVLRASVGVDTPYLRVLRRHVRE